jgi:hypothetical protein
MKAIYRLCASALCMASALTVLGQSKQGAAYALYNNLNDFTTKQLSYPVQCGQKKDKLRIDAFFGSRWVIVIHEGKKQRIEKSTLYGYRDCSGNDFRFYDRVVYKVMDTEGFYLYSRAEFIQIKGFRQNVTKYYFSLKGDDLMQPLTAANLKKAFPGNKQFHYSLDAQFRDENDLAAYDPYSKQYKIKDLFNQSTNRL